MAAPARVHLGATTTNRKWWWDVNTGANYANPTWTPVGGTVDFKWFRENTMKDDSDRDTSDGAMSEVATAYKWGIESKLTRKLKSDDEAAYDVGQEKLRTIAGEIGIANVLDTRFYEMNVNDAGTIVGPRIEAHRGYIAVGWSEDGGPMDEFDTVSVKCSGRGTLEDIAHPNPAVAVVPTVTALVPATGAAAGGGLIHIYGTGFFLAGVDDVVAATGVKLGGAGGTAFTNWVTLSDGEIVATLPAKAAGTHNVVVYNAVGVSTVVEAIVTS